MAGGNVKLEDYKGIHRNSCFFCLVTLHLWGRIFKKFPDLRGLAYADDGNIIGPISQTLSLGHISELNQGFKMDGNLVPDLRALHHVTCMNGFNFFLQNDPNLQDIA